MQKVSARQTLSQISLLKGTQAPRISCIKTAAHMFISTCAIVFADKGTAMAAIAAVTAVVICLTIAPMQAHNERAKSCPAAQNVSTATSLDIELPLATSRSAMTLPD